MGGATRVCPDSDGNRCTEPRCDAAKGTPESAYCVESPLDGNEVEGPCFRFRCDEGVETAVGPSAANDCAALEVPKTACVASFVCDPEVVVRAASLQDAESLAATDPFVRSGVRMVRVRRWQLSCDDNGHMLP